MDRFGNLIQDISARYPYMTLPGNHEIYGNFSHYFNRYLMPKNSVQHGLYYSLDLGLVHYITINTNVLNIGTEDEIDVMLEWLEQDLAESNNNREKRPWIVVMSHHPLYCSHNPDEKSIDDCVEDTLHMRMYLEEIYHTYRVDLVLQGHMHNYERDQGVYKDQLVNSEVDTQNMHVNMNAPLYILTGNGGNDVGRRDKLVSNPSEWEAFQSYEYGFGRLQIFNETCLLWQQFSSKHKIEIDYVYLFKFS